jgi:tetratricopeptide (TPR) repeat protein
MSADRASFQLGSRKARLTCAGVVFIVALATYSLTLAPGVALVDSGELIVAARTLGVPHPPGFPLYVLLAHIATLIPIGSIAVRVNFASAVFAALASATVTLVAAEALLTPPPVKKLTNPRTRGRQRREKRSATTRSQTSPYSESGVVAIAACVASGLLLAFSRTLWSYATIAEVYTLNTLLIAGVFLFMFHWRRLLISDTGQPRAAKLISKQDRWLNAAAVLFGLGLGVHHVTVGLMLPALAWLVLATAGPGFFWSKRLLRAAAFAFAGAGIYIYLPLAASRSPILNWGDPQTLQRFWWHVTGRQYRVFFSFSSERMGHDLLDLFILVGREFGPWFLAAGLLVALAGAVALFKRDWKAFWFLALIVVCDVIYSIGYEIAEDKDAYYLPAFVAIVVAAVFAADWITRPLPRFGRLPLRAWNIIASAILLLAPAVALFGNLPFNNRSRYFIAQDYVGNILNVIEPGGMLLTRDWQVYSPMMYVNQIEQRRPDVIAIDIQQLRRSWYYDYLRQAYSDMIEQARAEVDAFLEDLTHWEQDPDLYQSDLSLNKRINTRFYDMIQAFVTNHLKHAPVYVTQDIALNKEASDAELTKWLSDSFQRVPQGLVFQIAEKGASVQLNESQPVTRGLADGTSKFENDDVVNLKVIPVYVNMLYTRGRSLAGQGRHEEAVRDFRQALDINPNLSSVQQALNESQSAMRKLPAKP